MHLFFKSIRRIFLIIVSVISLNQLSAQTQLGADIDGEGAGDWSGYSVSMSFDGSTLAIGAPYNNSNRGHVRVYRWNGSTWVQQGSDIDGEAAGDQSGWSVSLSSDGKTVAIGALYNSSNRGHVRVYRWNGSAWVQQGSDIDGETAYDWSGYSVSLSSDGAAVAIGAPGNSSFRGHVRVYRWNGSTWVQQGSDIDGEATNDFSGYSVSLSSDGTTIAIGAPYKSGFRGHVRVYRWNGSAWIQQGSDIDGEAADDESGTSVSLSSDGTTVAIGALGNSSYRGHVRVYRWNGSAWVQQGSDIDGEAAEDLSGTSVSLSSDGTTVGIGAPGNSSYRGHVRVYRWNGSVWVQQGSDIDGEAAGDQSGYSVSLSSDGTTVAIGASGNDGNANSAGHVRVYSICSELTISYLPSAFGNFNISTQGGSNGRIKTLVEGGTAPYTYSWTGPSTATGANPTGLKAGVYFLHVVDDNGCEGTGGPWNLVEP